MSPNRREQVLRPLPLGQHRPQPGGGDVHQAGEGEGGKPRPGEAFGQKLPLGGKDLLSVLSAPAKGAHPGQLQNFLRVVPQVEGEEHIRPHKQPQLRPGVLRLERGQGVGGVAAPSAVQLQPGDLDPLRHQQGVGQFFRHGQPVLRSWGVFGQLLVGRHGVGDQDQLIQPQLLHRRPCRRQMPQVGGIEGPAVNSDFHN